MTSKNRKNTKRSTLKALIVKKLSTEFAVEQGYVYSCLRGDAKSETADAIRKRYNELEKTISSTLSK